jgi:hypothetical protein
MFLQVAQDIVGANLPAGIYRQKLASLNPQYFHRFTLLRVPGPQPAKELG